MLRSIYVYMAVIFIGLIIPIGLMKIIPEVGVTLLLVYVFIFRPYVDANRLISKKVLGKKNIWKKYPFWGYDFAKELYTK